MNIDQLEAFIHIALSGSFSKAGEMLYSTQPSISAKVKSLEKELNCTLFERTSTKVLLSEEGKLFLPYAQNAVKHIQNGRLTIENSSKGMVGGEVHVAIVFSGAEYFLPKIASAFHKQYPDIKLVVHSGHSNQVVEMVRNHETSLGIVRSISHADIESQHLERDDIILVFHPNNPLAAYESINLQELENSRFVLFKRETRDWLLINNAVKKGNSHPNVIIEMDSVEGVKQLVKNNIGASFLPRFAVEQELEDGELKSIFVEGMPVIRRDFELITKKGRELDKATEVFRNFVVNSMQA
ncbi:LysR family transcriptional regulator [Lentibacillus lipolyticus]|nr:LysR family transcriptional regulator [Lentibacillus lipolyticus]